MRTRLWIVGLGVLLGLALRFTFGEPPSHPVENDELNLPIETPEETDAEEVGSEAKIHETLVPLASQHEFSLAIGSPDVG